MATSMLCIGDSLTYWNHGFDKYVSELAPTMFPAEAVGSEVKPGASLEDMLSESRFKRRIKDGAPGGNPWDVVVLQDDMPEASVEAFRRAARALVGCAKSAGCKRPILLAAWGYARLAAISTEVIANAHRELGSELGVEVAPVGRAFSVARERASAELGAGVAFELLGPDGEHPSPAGTFLMACTLIATLLLRGSETVATGWQQSWGCTEWRPAGVDEGTAEFLQDVAAQAVREWNAQ
jgi:hypothetical protein